jgi:hypothetical protein
MGLQKSFAGFVLAMACVAAVVSAALGQTSAQGEVQIPKGAIALEGTPLVRIESTEDQVTRRQLTDAEVATNRLRIHVENGKYFWTSRGNLPLTLTSSSEFTYLASSEPGKYVRFRRVSDRITYVEHIDTAHGSVTYWGELRIVLGKS